MCNVRRPVARSQFRRILGPFAVHTNVRSARVLGLLAASSLLVGCGEPPPLPPSPCDSSLTVPLSDELLRRLGDAGNKALPCRPAAAGEVLINEVVIRPAGRDLDGDGKSSGRDELIEVVSLTNEAVHLRGAMVVYGGAPRGEVIKTRCLAPYHSALIVGSTTGAIADAQGMSIARLNKTLRLTDNGGALALVGVAGDALDHVAVPMASDATEGAVTRQMDGRRGAELTPHALLPHANGAQWSPGRCSDGEPFPMCITEGVIDRETARRDPRAK